MLTDCVSQDEPSPVCVPDMKDSECAKATGCFRTEEETNPECYYIWVAEEPSLELSCFTLKDEEVCNGRYTLATTDGRSGPAMLTIARRLQ